MPRKVILRLIITKIKGYRPRELVTSLTDNNNYTYNDIAKLYCDRWIIEVYYRELKHILKVENFHSEYVDGVYQEIFASMILTIILQKYILKSSTKYNIPFHEISFKKSFHVLSVFIFLIEISPESRILEELMMNLIAHCYQKSRPGRSYKRVFYRKIKCKYSKSK